MSFSSWVGSFWSESKTQTGPTGPEPSSSNEKESEFSKQFSKEFLNETLLALRRKKAALELENESKTKTKNFFRVSLFLKLLENHMSLEKSIEN